MSDSTLEDLGITPGQQFNRSELDNLLTRVNCGSNQLVSSLYLKPGDQSEFMSGRDSSKLPWIERLATLDRKILESETGLIGLSNGDHALVVLPPFPLTNSELFDTWNLQPLHDLDTD